MNTSSLIQKVWNFCHTLRDDGLGYGDYLEQLTFLLFLKMADEYATGVHQAKHSAIPEGLDWASLRSRSGVDLEQQYFRILQELGHEKGMLGAIFFKAQNKIQDPAKLSRLVQLIDAENWLRMGTDVKGDLYEGLLQKNAEDTKSGAGQYFTPRPLIRAMVECMRPLPMKTIADPACGTGGFFLAAHEWLNKHRPKLLGESLNIREKEFLRFKTFHGWEIVPGTRRLCLMNLVLHGVGTLEAEPPIKQDDALLSAPGKLFDYVLANPPFGNRKSWLRRSSSTWKRPWRTSEPWRRGWPAVQLKHPDLVGVLIRWGSTSASRNCDLCYSARRSKAPSALPGSTNSFP